MEYFLMMRHSRFFSVAYFSVNDSDRRPHLYAVGTSAMDI